MKKIEILELAHQQAINKLVGYIGTRSKKEDEWRQKALELEGLIEDEIKRITEVL